MRYLEVTNFPLHVLLSLIPRVLPCPLSAFDFLSFCPLLTTFRFLFSLIDFQIQSRWDTHIQSSCIDTWCWSWLSEGRSSRCILFLRIECSLCILWSISGTNTEVFNAKQEESLLLINRSHLKNCYRLFYCSIMKEFCCLFPHIVSLFPHHWLHSFKVML